jgi:hypothetical protein
MTNFTAPLGIHELRNSILSGLDYIRENRGTTALASQQSGFRFPYAVVSILQRHGRQAALHWAREWAIGKPTEQQTERWLASIVKTHRNPFDGMARTGTDLISH